MNGWSFWIAQGDRFRAVDVYVSDFATAEAAALARVGGKVESYSCRASDRMAK